MGPGLNLAPGSTSRLSKPGCIHVPPIAELSSLHRTHTPTALLSPVAVCTRSATSPLPFAALQVILMGAIEGYRYQGGIKGSSGLDKLHPGGQ